MGSEVSTPDKVDGKYIFNEVKVDAPLPVEAPIGPRPVNTNIVNPLSDENFRSGTEEDYKEFLRGNATADEANDQEFPATDSSLYVSNNPGDHLLNLDWKRIHELSKNPHLLQEGGVRDDVMQGHLSDCWFLSSIASICRIPKFFKRVLPPGQEISASKYSGYFYFRFWRFGEWTGVTVDDKLPVRHGKLVYGRCRDPDEFWLPLMEKAFAKFHGSYEALDFGTTTEAMEDLTGGIAGSFELKNVPPAVFHMLVKALRNNSFACTAYHGPDKLEGLVTRHAYSVTAARRVRFRGSIIDLIRVRNPWGQFEWTGDWSDGSALWNELDPKVRERLEYADKNEGEFWMNFGDFAKHFQEVRICTVGPDFDMDGRPSGDNWYLTQAKGAWVEGESDGGSRNNPQMYSKNPQYYLHLREADTFDPDNDDPSLRNKCSVIIGLMQEEKRYKKRDSLDNLFLKVEVFKVSSKPTRKLDADYIAYELEIGSTGNYKNSREVCMTAELDPGYYVIVVSTFKPGGTGAFLLRTYTEKPVGFEEIH